MQGVGRERLLKEGLSQQVQLIQGRARGGGASGDSRGGARGEQVRGRVCAQVTGRGWNVCFDAFGRLERDAETAECDCAIMTFIPLSIQKPTD